MLVPLVFFAGATVDYSRATKAKVKLSSAIDDAVLLAVKVARRKISEGATDGVAFATAVTEANSFFNGLDIEGASTKTLNVTLARSDTKITANSTGSATIGLNFGGILGVSTVTVGTSAQASAFLQPYVDVALLIDVSGSMAIGADQSAIDWLNTKFGCAFACHDGNKVYGTNLDAYQYAIANGILLRTTAINNGIGDFVDYLSTQDPGRTRIRLALYGFSDDLHPLVTYTTNLPYAKANLPQQTDAASEYTGATHFAEVMPQFTTEVGVAGDGSAASKPRKLVVIATDGVQDPNRTWTWNLPLRTQVNAFDPTACAGLKSAGVTVGIIHTPYLPMTWDWGYNATVGAPSLIGGAGSRNDDIAPQLKKCASDDGLYVVATAADIGAAFKKIFENFAVSRIEK